MLDFNSIDNDASQASSSWILSNVIYFFAFFGISLSIYFYLELTDGESFDYFVLIGILIILIVLYFASLFLPFVRNKLSLLSKQRMVAINFAKRNNFSYIDKALPSYGDFNPSLEGGGVFARKEQIIKGWYEGLPFQTYVYTYRSIIPNRAARISLRVYQVTLPKRLPHIFLATKRGIGTSLKTNTLIHFDDKQRFELEGDFNNYFITYSHPRHRTETLSILAPNVMETLTKTNKDFNVEIIGDQLFLYSPNYLFYKEEVEAAFNVLETLVEHIKHRLKSWKLVLPNDKKFPFIHGRAGVGTITFGGRYFNGSKLLLLWIAAIQSIRITVSNISLEWKIIQFFILIIVISVMFYILLILNKKYKSSLIPQ